MNFPPSASPDFSYPFSAAGVGVSLHHRLEGAVQPDPHQRLHDLRMWATKLAEPDHWSADAHRTVGHVLSRLPEWPGCILVIKTVERHLPLALAEMKVGEIMLKQGADDWTWTAGAFDGQGRLQHATFQGGNSFFQGTVWALAMNGQLSPQDPHQGQSSIKPPRGHPFINEAAARRAASALLCDTIDRCSKPRVRSELLDVLLSEGRLPLTPYPVVCAAASDDRGRHTADALAHLGGCGTSLDAGCATRGSALPSLLAQQLKQVRDALYSGSLALAFDTIESIRPKWQVPMKLVGHVCTHALRSGMETRAVSLLEYLAAGPDALFLPELGYRPTPRVLTLHEWAFLSLEAAPEGACYRDVPLNDGERGAVAIALHSGRMVDIDVARVLLAVHAARGNLRAGASLIMASDIPKKELRLLFDDLSRTGLKAVQSPKQSLHMTRTRWDLVPAARSAGGEVSGPVADRRLRSWPLCEVFTLPTVETLNAVEHRVPWRAQRNLQSSMGRQEMLALLDSRPGLSVVYYERLAIDVILLEGASNYEQAVKLLLERFQQLPESTWRELARMASHGGGDAWKRAKLLLREMQDRGATIGADTFHEMVKAIRTHQDLSEAEGLLSQLTEQGMPVDRRTIELFMIRAAYVCQPKLVGTLTGQLAVLGQLDPLVAQQASLLLDCQAMHLRKALATHDAIRRAGGTLPHYLVRILLKRLSTKDRWTDVAAVLRASLNGGDGIYTPELGLFREASGRQRLIITASNLLRPVEGDLTPPKIIPVEGAGVIALHHLEQRLPLKSRVHLVNRELRYCDELTRCLSALGLGLKTLYSSQGTAGVQQLVNA
ncbi:hypothetical protein [Roseateles amylovorans]|uniref:Pentatricopeptide repeat domain-containing protein n=1 Tax=Roseateles amylovorans TaxID=2978473 RepID=A0ABY6AV69_9BURK|nr:hypothetical protein [Roseateles amylovorans]UXH77099.1 hypothetical protein N4261_19065 [Roseateles amylovorans]